MRAIRSGIVGAGIVGVMWAIGCSSGGSSSTTSSSSTTTTGGTGGGSTTGSTTTGGTGGGSTTGSTTTSGTGGGSTTGTGGSGGYSCNTCLDPMPNAGAKAKECKAQGDACFADDNCSKIFVCTYLGVDNGMGGTVGPCDNSAEGACCTFDCYALIKAQAGDAAGQKAIDLYEAVDQCTTCGICKDVCVGADLYCAKYAMGAASCP